ncbi:MAG: hypothetical protein JSU00_29810 [Acidobacteria bacterium]|nr:hypothetical protein [Acidobacteriota bacterium]
MPRNPRIRRREFLALPAALCASAQNAARRVYIVPNFHPASCGWLTNFSKERVYCANSYLDHLDRVRDDPSYAFAISEVNNLIAIRNFQPDRFEELKRRIREGRAEAVNAFFLESTVNLSGGEALVRLGVEGLRWQRGMLGVKPRFAWTIDVCGTHDQMAQIAAGLGLEAMVYTRKNPTGKSVHWAESPDGTRILALSPGHYSELGFLMAAADPLTPKQFDDIARHIDDKRKITPEGAPVLILAGSGDYALAPRRKENPREFLNAWNRDGRPEIRFATLSQYFDEVAPLAASGRLRIPTMRGGTAYDFNSFWIECPRVKSWFRRNEHALAAAEMLATAASLQTAARYPAEDLYRCWLLTFLSMDRNTLWGSAGGMVFEHETSWDVKDRLTWIEDRARTLAAASGEALLKAGDGVGLYNPLNWKRSDPMVLPAGQTIEGWPAQALDDGATLCTPELHPCSIASFRSASKPAPRAVDIALPDAIETEHYTVRIDPKTGAIASLRLKPGGREMLSGPANTLVAERPKTQRGDPGDFTLDRPERNRLDSSSAHVHTIRVARGEVATMVHVEGEFMGATARRTLRFYRHHPRIDFETELNDLPNLTVVVAEFPLAGPVNEVRRGVPYGFSHGAGSKPNPDLHGWTRGITPAVRWSHYAVDGAGMAILDRGVTGREINGDTPIIYLYNATDKYYGYPNAWLSGKGKHVLEYAAVFHTGAWEQARIPHMAFEYNSPAIVAPKRLATAAKPFLTTSDNVIVESMRRAGDSIEVRLAECLGAAGQAEVTLLLPHHSAALTNLVGDAAKPLPKGPRYVFPVRPQQIVTLRFRTSTSVAEPQPLTEWDLTVPPNKLAALHEYSDEKGHPPRGA